jgi:hypothetical protein
LELNFDAGYFLFAGFAPDFDLTAGLPVVFLKKKLAVELLALPFRQCKITSKAISPFSLLEGERNKDP